MKNIFSKKQVNLQERYPQYDIGKWTYGDLSVKRRGDGASLSVGNFCSIAAGVQVFLGGEHRIDWVTTFPFSVLWDSAKYVKGHPRSKGDVIIGHDVWIGTEAFIMSGVTIETGAVVGARSVVTKNIPAYSVVAGNPAQVVKKGFEDNIISRLLESRWWDWEDSKIEEFLPFLLNDDIEKFFEAIGR